ncbi:unnamed protein product [Clonostachys rhizophaga]|uniref:Uncharacterized protein n=1 Tax=Clonostachys rhizophaga TaxID=160324 RepID=A0A9N9VN38_9HYPO|nr:unnamed protein product [Clonostachys rhizophaga]
MPFVGPDAQLAARKRRWEHDEDDDEMIRRLYGPEESPDLILLNHPHYHQPSQQSDRARKILPLSNKRARIAEDEIHLQDNHNSRRRLSQQLRVLHDQTPSLGSKAAATKPLLTPCHICHRRPTKKSQLDSFAECEGCGERTCFVCIRQCQGWSGDEGSALSEQEVLSRSFHMDDIDDMSPVGEKHPDKNFSSSQTRAKGWDAHGHRTVICSRCCVERGTEGDVVCLGCLSTTEMA